MQTTTTTAILQPLYRSTCASRHFLEEFVGAKFYCPHVPAEAKFNYQHPTSKLHRGAHITVHKSDKHNTVQNSFHIFALYRPVSRSLN